MWLSTLIHIIFLQFLHMKNSDTAAVIKTSDQTDNINYQKYLLLSSFQQQNYTRKFIVDVLWLGISELSKSKLSENIIQNKHCLTTLQNYYQGVTRTFELWALKSKL